jgi:cob(I)alamin adenosyltransferase
MKRGLVYIFTGDGKGKTSAALGVVVRALAQGWKVGWVSWYKEASWGISEHKLPELLKKSVTDRLTFLPLGKGFYIQHGISVSKQTKIAKVNNAIVTDNDSPAMHKKTAAEALKQAEVLLKKVDVLVLDEVCNAISDNLLPETSVLALLKKRKRQHIILTGRNASTRLEKHADLVSVIQKKKHPYDKGMMAVKGLDF